MRPPILPRSLQTPSQGRLEIKGVLVASLFLALSASSGLAEQAAEAPEKAGPDIATLPAFEVKTDADDKNYDATGIGTMELEENDAPFSNDILAGASEIDEPSSSLDAELGQLAAPDPADLSAGQSRLDLRGFPTPRLRNGFTQLGVPEVLNPDKNQKIAGALVSVLGRAAPGGITNLVTSRPRPKAGGQLGLSASSNDSQRLFYDSSRVLQPKRSWSRTSLSYSHKTGPETFTRFQQRSLGQSLTRRLSRATSLMLQFDWTDLSSRPSGGIPLHRATATGKIIGPYLPLANFHSYGPHTEQRKQLTSLALQLESQYGKNLSLRATTQFFTRRFDENRFTRGEYLLDEQVFSGVREPRHGQQRLNTLSGELEATLRLHGLGATHKLLLSTEGALAKASRLERTLDKSSRDSILPLSVRRFDPQNPDYFTPAYSLFTYSRVLTDRDETTLQTAVKLSERTAFGNGRLVMSAGLRQDWVDLEITDYRPGAALPFVKDRSRNLSWHLGANYIALPRRLLLFANASTAFEPSLRVDSRTGLIQGNETTAGWECGATGLLLHRTLVYTVTAFDFRNRNIARRNPLYDDPVFDANNTQPQLVAGGQERFRGGLFELRWRPQPFLTVSCRHGYTEAITTASPDLPQEVGLQLSRLPRVASSLNLRFAPPKSDTGPGLSLGLNYIGPHTAWYESVSRERLNNPGYTVVSTNFSYQLKRGTRSHQFTASIKNLLDTDLLAKIARNGAGRELSLGYQQRF